MLLSCSLQRFLFLLLSNSASSRIVASDFAVLSVVLVNQKKADSNAYNFCGANSKQANVALSFSATLRFKNFVANTFKGWSERLGLSLECCI